MIEGLKLPFTGHEIIRAIDEQIARHEASIQFKRDEIDGKIEHKKEVQWQLPVEAVLQEIAIVQHRIDVLTMYRERIDPGETYLLGRRALKRANLLPPEPSMVPEFAEEETETRWVTRSA